MTDLVKSFLLNNVLHVELNRPDKYHAMTTEMYAALTDIFADARDNDEVRVLLFKGGKDCFCAGNDIADFLNTPVLSEGNEVLAYLHELANFDKPLVAAVSGPAIGIATTFMLHCDLIYATEKSVFSTPFVNLGICPEAASTYLLPRHIGYTKSAELLFLGERFDAAKALDLGLITAIIPTSGYWEHAQAQAEALAKKPVNALRATKRLLRADSAAIHQTIDREAKIFVGLRDSDEARAIFEQFLKK